MPGPTALPGKTIHQRNKSTPVLSSLMQAGALKQAAKRTAFADVSNTVKTNQHIKDDSALSGKNGIIVAKPSAIQVQEAQKPAGLLRPAQRPLSNLDPKLNVDKTTSEAQDTKQNLRRQTVSGTSARPVQSVNEPQRVATKKNTMVFKDVPEVLKYPATIEEEASVTVASTAPISQVLPRRQKSKTDIGADTVLVDPALIAIQGPGHVTSQVPSQVPLLDSLPVSQLSVNDSSNQVSAPRAYIDAVESQLPVNSYERNSANTIAELDYLADLESKVEEMKRTRQHAEKVIDSQLPGVPDPEEWVDPEADQDYEDGYTTARSLKLRSEGNTTGGVTVVLNPKVTARVERELSIAKEIVESSRTEEDIEDEAWDTSMVAEYGEEIFDYMLVLENRMRPNPHYMDNQAEIQWSMRSVLMDWLVQVHHRFQLLPETLFLSVNYVDRFLSCKVVSLGKLQLVGATAIFVAAKYEEINCPSVQEIVYMVDNGYTTDEILKAERFMLSMLQFELGWPGPMSFLRRISKADDYDLETRTLAKYFLEITVMDERFVGCTPSFTAAGAHCLARLMLRKGDWSPAHTHYSGYTYSQLRQLLSVMVECCEDPHKHHAYVFEKYTDKRFKHASLFVEKEIKKGFRLPSLRESTPGYGESISLPWKRKS
ncbi:MAG: hypothetical protein M1820_001920 [Bogoriella megaspora]|nr:MAG: hypothetical protein M1820_001920 [Bogoriella megaspora]